VVAQNVVVVRNNNRATTRVAPTRVGDIVGAFQSIVNFSGVWHTPENPLSARDFDNGFKPIVNLYAHKKSR
jgi:hypothetical protein